MKEFINASCSSLTYFDENFKNKPNSPRTKKHREYKTTLTIKRVMSI